MVKLVYTRDLKSLSEGYVGSSPTTGTKHMKKYLNLLLMLFAASTTATDLAVVSFPSPDKFQLFFTDDIIWKSKTVNWYYNPQNEPPQFKGKTVEVFQRAMNIWASECGVKFVYKGEASNVFAFDRVPTVSWFAFSGDMAKYAGYTFIYNDGRWVIDADIGLNTTTLTTITALEYIAIHEVGHMIGLNHSNFEGNMMSGPPWSQYSYPSYLRADDIEGCRLQYGWPGSPPIVQEFFK